ncbi:phospholipase A1 [Oceanospirillum multiglobuliferum]|uniref:Phospholipase A1 n=1 Tax=Oceanospirillum multiglobuliferum TaxID=64969 RepID=A0A1T4R4D9_9GAMM|nr:phospholipase A [Oceanospirillum multiglobuliferum]OPX55246.1 hypothetical protein BTE48_09950 [Oceanospirillum multiglobuliferum]SKA10735.1 phospholipase A1 [Oceanospirillum multiglobuliferum]
MLSQTTGRLLLLSLALSSHFSYAQTETSETETDDEVVNAVRQRLDQEVVLASNPLVFLPYKANYFLPASYYSGHQASSLSRGVDYGPTEAQFQLSFKFPVATGLLTREDALIATYTQQSYWQIYQNSAPFRETMYEPELVYGISTEYRLMKRLTLEGVLFGINHQSNGQGGDYSRSWNRLFAEAIFATGDWGLSLKRWYRIPEASSQDDNVDLASFVGLNEVAAAYRHNNHVVTFRLRNHLESQFKRGNAQVSWSFPIGGRMKGYILARTGYGDTLADYDQYIERIGLGVAINDVL